MHIIKKLFKKNRYDIQFFCSSPIDEIWIRSTLIKCHSKKIKVQLSVIGKLKPIIKNMYLSKNIEIVDGPQNSFKKSARYKCKLCITASSGINRNIYKTNAVKLIHMPHSLSSLHMIYPEDAFWGFDEIFCAGPHHKSEVEALNKKYNLEISTSNIGYGKLDLLKEDYANFNLNNQTKEFLPKKTKILIAPSWGKDNILDKFGPELSLELKYQNYDVTFRPHPIFFNEKSSNFKKIIELSKKDLITFESPFDGDAAIFYADILIGDYSGRFSRVSSMSDGTYSDGVTDSEGHSIVSLDQRFKEVDESSDSGSFVSDSQGSPTSVSLSSPTLRHRSSLQSLTNTSHENDIENQNQVSALKQNSDSVKHSHDQSNIENRSNQNNCRDDEHRGEELDL